MSYLDSKVYHAKQALKAVVKGAVFVLAAFTLQANAQTFYVASGGSNENGNGSQGDPWATISFAIDQVSDGATILVAAGTYNGRVRLDQAFQNGITIRSATPYQAKLRHNSGAAVICFTCQGVSLEGFDIAHSANNTGALVIQIQSTARRVTLRNNIIHDSTNNDLLKINNGASDVLVQGNMFYNQSGSDEHIDINSVTNVQVLDNVFFNSTPQAVTSSYIVVKDSNANSDGVLGAKDIAIRRNIFFNWQGNNAQSFVRVGEDGTANFEAQNVLIENNLMLGNSNTLMRSALTIQGSNNVRFQFNTIVGNLPSRSFAARLLATGANQPNQNIVLSNNIWSDPTASMGGEGFNGADVFDAPNGDNGSFTLDNNLYHNGGSSIPADSAQGVNISDDSNAVIANPQLPSQESLELPVFNGTNFGGPSSIRAVFEDIANRFGKPSSGSAAIDRASLVDVPEDDLFGANRSAQADIGAIEVGARPPTRPPLPRNGNPAILSWLILLLD